MVKLLKNMLKPISECRGLALGRLLETTATPLTLGRNWCMLPKSTSFGELQGSFGV